MNYKYALKMKNLASKRAVWKNISDELLPDFPKLSEEDLHEITLGVYQLKQARSYTQEHLSADGSYDISVYRHDDGLLRAKIQSCHISSKQYCLWISYDVCV